MLAIRSVLTFMLTNLCTYAHIWYTYRVSSYVSAYVAKCYWIRYSTYVRERFYIFNWDVLNVMHIHVYTWHAHVSTLVYAYMQAYMHTYTQAHAHAIMHAHTCACK